MGENQWQSIGVDWDSGAWVAVGYSASGQATADVFETIDEFWDRHGADADRIVVDVPIGLCGSTETAEGRRETEEELSRTCDDLARGVIGPRSSSVFTAPCREAARKAVDPDSSYEEVNETNREQTGKGLMRQAASIAPGIVEVEDLLLNGADQSVLLEGHPEVCFRAFADEMLQYNKRTAPGMAERLAALQAATEYEQGTWRALAEDLGEEGYDTGTDDLLDALGLALTARAPEGQLQTLPQAPPSDGKGLPMQMVYRRAEPFRTETSA